MDFDWLLTHAPNLLIFAGVVAAYIELRAAVRTLRRDVDNDKSGRRAVLENTEAIARVQEAQKAASKALTGMERAVLRVHERLDEFAREGLIRGRSMPTRSETEKPP